MPEEGSTSSSSTSSTENPNVRLGSDMRRRCRTCGNRVAYGHALVVCPVHGYWLRVNFIEGWDELEQVYYRIPEQYMLQQAEAWFQEHGPPLSELPGHFEPSDDLLEGLEGFMID
ncbi:hypothetical protein K435DRAFT_868640 [Dendrothele bispora CBS 962.96]|uniref:Uncharacterized protein n=1 Tax=Dendrothele bispora (strain CBS 962.96) TaxID=1314807 RepID=A0A4S8LCL6_DENBC|nr:hypothetical protein K435DRAFT_868640 [Dendrothele bispora CBS 962.96]